MGEITLPRVKQTDNPVYTRKKLKVRDAYKDQDPHEYVKSQLQFNLDLIVDQLLNLVGKGNERAVFYAMDRILGKPIDQSMVSVTKEEKKVVVNYVNDWRKKQLATEEELQGMQYGTVQQ